MVFSIPAAGAAKALQVVVEERGLEALRRCYQCRKCTNGCPLTFAMDWMPHQVVRAVQLGLDEEVLRSKTIWVCAACQTCTTRCPNDIDIAHLMDLLRQESRARSVPAAEPDVRRFHEAFLASVRRHGRVFELGMLVRYKLAAFWGSLQKGGQGLSNLPGRLWEDLRLGWAMFRRGRLRLWPSPVRSKQEIRQMGHQGTQKPGPPESRPEHAAPDGPSGEAHGSAGR